MKKYPIIKSDFFYCESVSHASSYELKSFAPKYDEESLSKYLRIKAKEHEENLIERTYIVRDNKTGTLVGWFSLQSSTLPYQEKDIDFHIPAIEMTNFAVDDRYYRNHKEEFSEVKIGEYIFFTFVMPIAQTVSKLCGCRDIFIFAHNERKLLDYYQNVLGFRYIENTDSMIEMPISNYSKQLVFMYQTLYSDGYVLPEIDLRDTVEECD